MDFSTKLIHIASIQRTYQYNVCAIEKGCIIYTTIIYDNYYK